MATKSLKSNVKSVASRVSKALKSDAAKVKADAKAVAARFNPRTPPRPSDAAKVKADEAKASKAAVKVNADIAAGKAKAARAAKANPPTSALPPGHSNAAAAAAERQPSKAVRDQKITMPTLPSKTALDTPISGQFGDKDNPATDVHGNKHLA